jgi:hypothetical protein
MYVWCRRVLLCTRYYLSLKRGVVYSWSCASWSHHAEIKKNGIRWRRHYQTIRSGTIATKRMVKSGDRIYPSRNDRRQGGWRRGSVFTHMTLKHLQRLLIRGPSSFYLTRTSRKASESSRIMGRTSLSMARLLRQTSHRISLPNVKNN